MAKENKSKLTTLAFVAVSATAASRIKAFPVISGFSAKIPAADLQTQLAKGEDWNGYAVVTDGNKTSFRKVARKKA